nr:MAG TPA: hypothetical protein [Caudoviricetes sp.]
MKRYCKNIDITNRELINRAVCKCLKNKMDRLDVLRMFSQYSDAPYGLIYKIAKEKQFYMFEGMINTVVDGIREEILTEKYSWKKSWYTYKRECNKVRKIGIQDVKQQLYDYIAVEGLSELFSKRIGYYQCAAIPNKGQVMGMKTIKKWLRNKNLRYAWQGDAKHYYENIHIPKLKQLLRKYVKNQALLKLVFKLIDSFEKGLSIGSYLSQYLANFYMSFGYHYAKEKLLKTRRSKTGNKVVNMVSCVLIYMDDILFLSTSLKYLKSSIKIFKKWILEEFKITIKPSDKIIDLLNGYIDMMGFLISRTKVLVRSRIFLRFRKSITKVRKTKTIFRKEAQRILSRYGWIKNSDCRHWEKKNKVLQIVKICKEMISHGQNVIYIAAT